MGCIFERMVSSFRGRHADPDNRLVIHHMAFRVLIHALFVLFHGLLVERRYLFGYLTYTSTDPPMGRSVDVLYTIQLLFHSASFVFDFLARDRALLLLHHLLTVIVIGISWACRLQSFGLPVMLVMDLTDIPVYMLRISKAQKLPDWVQVSTAVLTVGSWTVLRGVFVGHILYRSMLLEDPVAAIRFGRWLLAGLWFMSAYWTSLIVHKIYRTVRNGGSRVHNY